MKIVVCDTYGLSPDFFRFLFAEIRTQGDRHNPAGIALSWPPKFSAHIRADVIDGYRNWWVDTPDTLVVHFQCGESIGYPRFRTETARWFAPNGKIPIPILGIEFNIRGLVEGERKIVIQNVWKGIHAENGWTPDPGSFLLELPSALCKMYDEDVSWIWSIDSLEE